MITFTKQEKCVLLSVCIILMTGSGLKYLFKKYPDFNRLVNLIDSDFSYPKVDLNRASKEELEAIPYIGAYTAGQIILYREKTGGFKNIEEIKEVKGVREKNYQRFKPYLKVSRK